MFLTRLFRNLAGNNWLVVLLELVVVVVGIFLGIQASNWNEQRQSIADGIYYLDLLHRQLDAEIRMREADIAQLDERIEKIGRAYELLLADSWTGEEFDEFEQVHVSVYQNSVEKLRPSALRQLVDAGKVDLVQSRAIQEVLFGLDREYQSAINQSYISEKHVSDAVTVLTMEIQYGSRESIMAIPADADVLLKSAKIKWAIRIIYIMNTIQRSALKSLQKARVEAREELAAYLSLQ